jgi:putative membrane protein
MKPHAVFRLSALVMAASAAAVLGGCASQSRVPLTPGAQVAPANNLSLSEKTFVVNMASRTMYQLEVSKLAAERASDPRVKAYAQSMVARQTEFTNELYALMSARGVPPPKGLPADKATKLHRLESLPPSAAFDQGYVRVVGIEDHQANIALLEQGKRTAIDPGLRAWIDRTLPTMRKQLSVAESLASTITG